MARNQVALVIGASGSALTASTQNLSRALVGRASQIQKAKTFPVKRTSKSMDFGSALKSHWIKLAIIGCALTIILWKFKNLKQVPKITSSLKSEQSSQKELSTSVAHFSGMMTTLQFTEIAPAVFNEPALYLQDEFDMSFGGLNATCTSHFHRFPFTEAVRTGADGLVNVTYNMCCRNGGVTCWTASKPLQIPAANLEAIVASGKVTVNMSAVNLSKSLVFITGASSNHYDESLVLINSIQKFFPGSKTLYWDIGLSQEQARNVKSFCGVAYRLFNFTKYPSHVAILKTYAFKPLAIMESFMEYDSLWWVDASIRFTSANLDEAYRLIAQRHGILMFRDYNHSVWSTTYPQMYDYIGTDVEKLKMTVTAPGGSFIAVNTKELYSTVLYWFYACVLDVRCIAPILYPEPCDLKGYTVFAKCHRFDQSLLTMLAANMWGFESSKYTVQQTMFYILKDPTGSREVKYCTNT